MKRLIRWIFAPRRRIRELRVDLAAVRRYNAGLATENHAVRTELSGLGEMLIGEIVRQSMLAMRHPDPNAPHIFVWAGNAPEQLECVVAEFLAPKTMKPEPDNPDFTKCLHCIQGYVQECGFDVCAACGGTGLLKYEPRRRAILEQWWPGLAIWVAVVGILCWFWGCSPCPAADLRTLEWDANPESVTGYRLYKLPERMILATATGTVATVPLEVGEIVAVSAYNSAGESALSDPVTITAPLPTLDRSGWTATASTAEAIGENTPPANAIDGNPATIWHSQWNALAPHYIAVALPRAARVSRLDYTPRQDGNANGSILAYEIQSSDDGIDWQPWSAGTWTNDATTKTSSLPLRSVRYFRLWGNQQWASAAEINLRGTYDPEPPRMVRVTMQVSSDMSVWSDMSSLTIPAAPKQFFRVKIETNP